MIDRLKFTWANDKDIFDLLMSSKQKMTDKMLQQIALERGLLFSQEKDRPSLARAISSLPHDYTSLNKLIEKREGVQRSDKRTFVELPYSLTKEQITEAVDKFKANNSSYVVTTQQRRAEGAYINFEYHEVDYSRTRLIQRQKRDAGIEITSENERTVIRMPATERAREIVNNLKVEIGRVKISNADYDEIRLDDLEYSLRTSFFINLMNSIDGYLPQFVTKLRVASPVNIGDDEITINLDDSEVLPQENIGQISSVTLSGVRLLESSEYQALRRNGFYITGMVWRSQQIREPQDLMQFDAGFDDYRAGIGFKFGVRIAQRRMTDEMSQTFKALEANRQVSMWRLFESTSATVLKALREKQARQRAELADEAVG